MLSFASSSVSPPVRVPFWSPSISSLSKPLWLPISSNLIDYDWSSWQNYSKSLDSKSWFSVILKSSKIVPSYFVDYDQNLLKSWKDSTKEGQHQIKVEKIKSTKSTKSTKSDKLPPDFVMKFKLDLTQKQKDTFNKWFDTNRWVYNQGVEYARKNYKTKKKTPTKKQFRKHFVNDDAFKDENQWAKDTPYDIRESAINDLCANIKSASALLKAGHIKHFKIKFKKKKEPQQSINVRNRVYKKSLTNNTFTLFRVILQNKGFSEEEKEIKAFEWLPDEIHYDSRLVRTRLGEWFLCVPMRVQNVYGIGGDSQTSSSISNKRICSLDPGVRTFQTIYDPNGFMLEIGKNDMSKIYRLSLNNDDLQSRISQAHGKRKYRMKKALFRAFNKIRNLVKEVHNKLVAFLVQNYDVILLPSFETSQMVVKKARKIRSKTVRSMLTWSHYSFKQKLLYKSGLTNGKCQVVICGEEYTSKTCTSCGHIHQKLGGAKTFKCPQCKLEIDRDYSGARNVFLKNSSHLGLRIQATLGLPPKA